MTQGWSRESITPSPLVSRQGPTTGDVMTWSHRGWLLLPCHSHFSVGLKAVETGVYNASCALERTLLALLSSGTWLFGSMMTVMGASRNGSVPLTLMCTVTVWPGASASAS